jgi:hypothetical protein
MAQPYGKKLNVPECIIDISSLCYIVALPLRHALSDRKMLEERYFGSPHECCNSLRRPDHLIISILPSVMRRKWNRAMQEWH